MDVPSYSQIQKNAVNVNISYYEFEVDWDEVAVGSTGARVSKKIDREKSGEGER